MKTRTGFVYKDKKAGNFYARVCYTQENGKRTSIKRKVENLTHGKQVLKEAAFILLTAGDRRATF